MNLIAFLWTPINWVWEKCPWWIKLPALVIVGPNLIVNIIIFYAFLVPFFTSNFYTLATPMKNQRDVQIAHIVEINNIKYTQIQEQMKEFRQQQSLMYQAQLDIASRLPSR